MLQPQEQQGAPPAERGVQGRMEPAQLGSLDAGRAHLRGDLRQERGEHLARGDHPALHELIDRRLEAALDLLEQVRGNRVPPRDLRLRALVLADWRGGDVERAEPFIPRQAPQAVGQQVRKLFMGRALGHPRLRLSHPPQLLRARSPVPRHVGSEDLADGANVASREGARIADAPLEEAPKPGEVPLGMVGLAAQPVLLALGTVVTKQLLRAVAPALWPDLAGPAAPSLRLTVRTPDQPTVLRDQLGELALHGLEEQLDGRSSQAKAVPAGGVSCPRARVFQVPAVVAARLCRPR